MTVLGGGAVSYERGTPQQVDGMTARVLGQRCGIDNVLASPPYMVAPQPVGK